MNVRATILILALGALSPSLFAADAAEAKAMCAQWAKEDGVEKDEMAQYMADCVADQVALAEPATSSEGDASKD